MLADPRRSLLVAAMLLAGAGVLFALVWWTAARAVLQWGDDRFLDLMENVRFEPLIALAKGMAFVGGAWCTWVVRVAVLAVLAWRRHWLHLAAFSLAIVTSELFIGPPKALFDRARPTGSLIETSGAAFPSGHAVAAGVTAVGVVIALMGPGPARWTWERRAALYASLMALSRTYLGAHWLSDVVAGGLLGSGVAIGWPALLVTWRARVRSRQAEDRE